MQPVATALLNVIESVTAGDPRDLVALIELYEPDVLPGANGFDPADASQRFAKIEITWLTLAYRRIVLDVGSITKSKGARSNRCTIKLSNADENRYAATWVTQNQVEGMRMVVRIISRSASTTLATSTIRFSGRCEKPEGFDSTQGSVSAVEDVGGIDVEFPPRLYLADDPDGRSPSDPLNEGFPWITLAGSFSYVRPEQDRSYGRGDSRRYIATMPYSSFDDTPLGDAIPMILGRSQIQMNRGLYVDRGRVTTCLDFACMGPIAGFLNFRMPIPAGIIGTTPENITYHLGEAGGTGTQIHDPLWPDHPYFSYTAYVGYTFFAHGGAAEQTIDAGQPTVATILGLVCSLPDGSGVFNIEGWTDNGAYLARHLLTNWRFFGINPAFIEDSACYATGQYNDAPLVDESNSGLIYIPDPDIDAAGVDFQRYRSTALINASRARYALGLSGSRPEELAVDPTDFEPFDPFDPPLVPVDVARLTRRFTTNVQLRKRVKGMDFFFNTLLPSFRGYLVWNWRGKIEPRSERPADFTHLRSAVVAAATTLPVEDVTPWTASGGLWGRALLGTPLATSEARKVTSAAYTSDANSITLAASKAGSVTVSASGATLTGGNSATRATGTVTIGGSPSAADTVTVVINGLPITYTIEGSETAATVAYMVAAHINAHTQLRRFVSASASGAVVTVSSKWGVLTLTSPALANSHAGPAANPTTAPAGLSASGSGSSLAAGIYRVAYANRTAVGSTYLSPYSAVTVTAGQQINIPALAFPTGVTSRDWYVSRATGDPEMALHTNNTTALGFAVTTVPTSTANFPPEYNASGEELVRIAIPFASNNQTAAILAQANLTRGNIFADTYKWPGGQNQPSYTEIVASHIGAKDDFAVSKVIVKDKALRARLGKDSPKELDLTAVDNSHQARRLVYFEFAKFIDRHWFNSLSSNGLALLLEEGDVICASDDSGGHVNVLTQVEEFTINLDDFTVSIGKARLYSSDLFREFVPKTRPVLPSVLRWVTTLNTELQLMDIPFYTEAQAAQGVGVLGAIRRASGSGDWTGSTIWLNTGDGYKEVVTYDVEAVTGEALSVLADHAAGTDSTSTVRVRLDNPTQALTTATDDELRAGANLFRLAGEIFQAKTCALVGGTDDEYDLSHLVRGLYGTEAETAGHVTGDEFTVLDGKVFHLPVDAKFIGTALKVKAVTTNQDLADAVEYTLLWEGNSTRPLSPARVELDPDTGLAPRSAAGDVVIQVWPRSDIQGIGDEYRIDYLEDDGSEIPGAFEIFREGTPQAAVLVSYVSGFTADKYHAINGVAGNSFDLASVVSNARARALQRIHQPDNYAEGLLKASGDTSVIFGLLSAGKDWRTAIPEHRIILSTGGGGNELEVREGGTTLFGGTQLYTEDASAYASTGKRLRFRLLGNKVQFFKDYADESTPPLAESIITPNYPVILTIDMTVGSGGSGYCREVTMTTNPLPVVVLTAAQQGVWYGGLKEPVRVEIAQNSRVGFGKPLEVEI